MVFLKYQCDNQLEDKGQVCSQSKGSSLPSSTAITCHGPLKAPLKLALAKERD